MHNVGTCTVYLVNLNKHVLIVVSHYMFAALYIPVYFKNNM